MKKLALFFAAVVAGLLGTGVWWAFVPATATPFYYTIPAAAAAAAVIGAVFTWRRRRFDKTLTAEAIGYNAFFFAVVGAALGIGVEFASQFQLIVAAIAGVIGFPLGYALTMHVASAMRAKRQKS